MPRFSRPCVRDLTVVLITGFVALLVPPAEAKDAYYHLPLKDLDLVEGKLPPPPPADWRVVAQGLALRPHAVVDGAGEAYVVSAAHGEWALAVRVPTAPRDLAGTVFVPTPEADKLVRLRFNVPASAGATGAEAGAVFLREKQLHYESLVAERIPGAAWFRHQARQARQALAGGARAVDLGAGQRAPDRPDTLEDTYALFTGGRALSENLQLDRLLPPRDPNREQQEVPLASVRGIRTKEMDWKQKLQGQDPPERDPLAKLIPADQHALFFPTFDALARLADEADRYGTLALHAVEPRSEDAGTRRRYERQLCLSLTGLGRLVGPHVVGSVAVTGSDPYLRVGSDVAVLFEAGDAGVLEKLLLAQVALARQLEPEAKPVDGEVGGVHYTGAVSPDRSVCAYVARMGASAVVVTNSKGQLERIAAAAIRAAPSIDSLDEYAYFRSRYRRGQDDETVFLILTDVTIRRWCSPRWRISDSRRTRAAALFAELQAANLDKLVRGQTAEAAPQRIELYVPELGDLSVTARGVMSSTYGSLEFMTPIVELPMETVTAAEASAYGRWRNTYESNWRQYFDPIAVRLSLGPGGTVAMDLSVMPLIKESTYRPLVSVTSGAAIAPGAGDPHAAALVHLLAAVNPKSPTVTLAAAFAANNFPGDRDDLLQSVGQCVAVYADDDPVWTELAQAQRPGEFLWTNFRRLPVALHVELKDAKRMDTFLADARRWIEQDQPGMTTWETLNHAGRPYVKIAPTDEAVLQEQRLKGSGLYYANTGKALVLTMDEGVLKRAIERQTKADAGPAADQAQWLGQSLALRVDAKAWQPLRTGLRRPYQEMIRRQAWANLPILNEWKRLYPDQDPVAMHERLWQTRLVDPAGGRYVWNEQFQTMESTTYGHPGAPKEGPATPPALESLLGASFGVTFEDDGTALRAKAAVQRQASRD